MKKITIVILSIILSFAARLSAAEHYVEDFNNMSAPLPAGWEIAYCNALNSDDCWSYFFDLQELDGRLAFNSKGTPEGTQCVLMTAWFEINGFYSAEFRFKNDGGGEMKLYALPQGESDYTQHLISDDFQGIAGFTKKSFSLAGFRGQTIRLVFVSESNHNVSADDPFHYIDDFRIKDTPTCATPVDLSANSISENSANLQWSLADEGDVAQTFLLSVWDAQGNIVLDEQAVSAPDFSYSLSGLTPKTEYIYRLKSDCQSGGQFRGYSDESEEYRFSTLMPAQTLPFAEGFDAIPSQIPLGWPMTDKGSVAVSSENSLGWGGKSLKLSSSADATALVLTPPAYLMRQTTCRFHSASVPWLGRFIKSVS